MRGRRLALPLAGSETEQLASALGLRLYKVKESEQIFSKFPFHSESNGIA